MILTGWNKTSWNLIGWNLITQIKKITISPWARDEFTQVVCLKIWPLQFVNRTKCIKKTVVSCNVTGEITLGTKLKIPIFTLTYPITYKVGFWYIKSLCIRNTVSKNTYQNFRDKRLIRPRSKYPIWQRSQPISYKANLLQKDNIYQVDFKYNTTYQNIQGKTKVRPTFVPRNA